MKKRLIVILLVLSLLASLCVTVFADETTAETTEEGITETTEAPRAPNQVGEDVYWSYSSGVLTLTGSGAMDDLYENVPWEQYKGELVTLVIEGDITYIGAHSFTNFDALEAIDFGDSLKEIGYEAFRSCDGLTSISLPETFKVFGEESFMSCKNLTEIHCSGGFPSFRMNSMWDTYVTIYFPADKPWGVEYIQQLEEAFQGRIEFLASDGSDPYEPEEETTEETTVETTVETEPETEETTVATTEAVTEVTEPVEENTEEEAEQTQEATEPQTSEETASPDTTPEETDQPETEEKPRSRSWIGIVIVLGIMVILALGAAIFGGKKRGGKYRAR